MTADETDETITELPAVPEVTEPALPGISAAKFRDELRTILLVSGFPIFMFGVVLHLWGLWLVAFMCALGAGSVWAVTARRAQRLRALRERGELP
jgi:hypothetical protein